MHVFLIVLGAPALIFAIFATALGFNPIRAAAWGAIFGMAAVGYELFEGRPGAYHPQLAPSATAWTPPRTDPVAPAPSGRANRATAPAVNVDPEPGKIY